MDEKIVQGVPSTVLLPSSPSKWGHISGPHAIDIIGMDLVKFDLADDIDVVVDLGQITKALYTAKLYPFLNSNEVFSIRNIIVDKVNNRITIVGNVLKRL